MAKVKIITLIGSSRFKLRFHEIGERLEKSGRLCLFMSFFQHADQRPITEEEREILHTVDRARIDLADEVWVINETRGWCGTCREWKDRGHYQTGAAMGWWVCPRIGCNSAKIVQKPYIGDDTLRELGYAANENKVVRWLNPPEPGALALDLK